MNENEAAATLAALRPDITDAYVWHSGGGIFLARIDLESPGDTNGDPAHILISEDGPGWVVGYYTDGEDDGSHIHARTVEKLNDAVQRLSADGHDAVGFEGGGA